MAEQQDDAQEKTEEPTAKRQEDARKKGQIARSQELNTLTVLLTGSCMLYLSGGHMARNIWAVMENAFTIPRERMFDPLATVVSLQLAFQDGLVLIAPFVAAMVIAALAGPLALGGWSFSAEALAPKLEKLSPLKGLKRMFALRSLMELFKSLIKFGLVFGVMMILINVYLQDFLRLGDLPLQKAFLEAGTMIAVSFISLAASLLLVVMFDVPFTLWDHKRKLKMSRQEIKDEMKQTEGRPEVKSRVRQLQQEIARGRMLEEVPKADVVVTNPTHFAVALKYDQGSDRAPKVVAKGADLIAAHIRNIAQGHQITLVSVPPLARALYYTTKVDHEVPQGLYLAVAQVLAYVFQLRAARQQGWKKPRFPKDIQVPDEYMKYSRPRRQPTPDPE